MFGFLVFKKRMISTLFSPKPTVFLGESRFNSLSGYFRHIIVWAISEDKVASLMSERREH